MYCEQEITFLAFECERLAELINQLPRWMWGDLQQLDKATWKLREAINKEGNYEQLT